MSLISAGSISQDGIFKNDFTRLAMRTEGGRAETGSVPLFPLSSRWIVPLWLQPSWLVSVTLQVREPLEPTEKYTLLLLSGWNENVFLNYLRGATFCFRENVYCRYNLAKNINIFWRKWENETLRFKPIIVTQKGNRTSLVCLFNHSLSKLKTTL